MLVRTPVSAVQGAAALVVELVVLFAAIVVVVVVKVQVQVTLRLVEPATVAVRLRTWVTTSAAEDWLNVTVTVFALPPPQPCMTKPASAANPATQLKSFRNFIPPASPAIKRPAIIAKSASISAIEHCAKPGCPSRRPRNQLRI